MFCTYRSKILARPFEIIPDAEIDISVSKLLGFKTFAKSLRVSVSENLVSEKKSQFRFRKNLVSEKSQGFGFKNIWSRKKVSVSVLDDLVSEKKKSK